MRLLMCLALTLMSSSAFAQSICIDGTCYVPQVQTVSKMASVIQPTKVERFQTTEMRTVTQMVPTEVQVPVVRTFETTTTTREVFDGGLENFCETTRRTRRVRGFNWGCIAPAVQAYFNCSMSKRASRRERGGFLSRLFFFRR